MKSKIIMAGALLTLSSAALGQIIPGSGLVDMAKAEEGSFREGFYLGYVVSQSEILWAEGYLCNFEGVNAGQAGEVVKKYLENSPELWHQEASLLVLEALVGAFPCPKEE